MDKFYNSLQKIRTRQTIKCDNQVLNLFRLKGKLLDTGLTAKIYQDGDIIYKEINKSKLHEFPYLISNEISALKRLRNEKHFPQLLQTKDNILMMDYRGPCLSFSNIPQDINEQIREITNVLSSVGIIHNDIKAKNLTIKNNVVTLLDFGFCSIDGNIHSPIPTWFTGAGNEEQIRRSVGGIMIDNKIFHSDKWITYHTLPFVEINHGGPRHDLVHRTNLFKSVYDFRGKTGIDLGSAIGGITFSMQLTGATMTGVELNKQAHEIALETESCFKTGANFILADVNDFSYNIQEYDVCLWLANFMWIATQKGMNEAINCLERISNKCSNMFFETSLGDGGAGAIMRKNKLTSIESITHLLTQHTPYKNIRRIGTTKNWHQRPLWFLC
jgi:serine/threonine protein kinase